MGQRRGPFDDTQISRKTCIKYVYTYERRVYTRIYTYIKFKKHLLSYDTTRCQVKKSELILL